MHPSTRFLQVIQEVLEWAWNRVEVARLAARREELYAEALAATPLRVSPGLPVFLDTLARLRVRHLPFLAGVGSMAHVMRSGPSARTFSRRFSRRIPDQACA